MRVRRNQRFESRATHQRAVIELDATAGRQAHAADVRDAGSPHRVEQGGGPVEVPGMAREPGSRIAEPVREHRTVTQDRGECRCQ